MVYGVTGCLFINQTEFSGRAIHLNWGTDWIGLWDTATPAAHFLYQTIYLEVDWNIHKPTIEKMNNLKVTLSNSFILKMTGR